MGKNTKSNRSRQLVFNFGQNQNGQKTNRIGNCLVLLLFFLILGLVGCSIIPKRVEFFQDKVASVPNKTEATKEKERQAAELVNRRIGEAKTAAETEHSSTNVIIPLDDAYIVSDALKLSLGPPTKIWSSNSENLAESLKKEIAKLNKKIDDYRADNEKNVGKKIEGSGAFSVSYFMYIGIIVGVLFLLSIAVKIYGMINPIVGIGANAAKIPVSLLSKGFRQIISAGESFKTAVDKKIEDPQTKELILELFRQSHEKTQNEEVQDVIKTLTK